MTEKPVITLRKIDIHVGLSEETPCYSADIYVDGKIFARTRNDGHGGCDMIDPPKGTHYSVFEPMLKALEAAINETYPAHSYDYGEGKKGSFDESLEILCHGLVWDFVDQRTFKSKLSRKVLIRRDGNVYEIKGKKCPQAIAFCLTKYGEGNVLNLLPFAEAWKIANDATA